MKNKIKLIAIGAIALIAACDQIPLSETREITNGIDPSACAVPTFNTINKHYRRVFLEDFTGAKCGNCPDAANEASLIHENKKDSVIIAAIHLGFFAKPDVNAPFNYDFRTVEGNLLDQTFGIDPAGLPKGMVNRADYNGNKLIGFTAWNSAIEQALKLTPKAELQIKTSYNASLNKVCIFTEVEPLTSGLSKLNLAIYLLEDSIVKPQKWYGQNPELITNYVHKHAFRTSLSGAFGTPLADSVLIQNKKTILSNAMLVKPEWNAKKCKVVALLIDPVSNEVLQAAETDVE